MGDSLVSVVIPCYNAAPYVGEAIESALGQSYPHTEVIVVNDGSTDGSQAVIDRYARRIRTVATENEGACHARNAGIEMASGEFVKFLDADDILRTHIVAKQVEEASHITDPRGIIYCNVGKMSEDGFEKARRSRVYPPPPEEHDKQLKFLLDHFINTQCPLHRRSFLLDVGGFDEGFVRLHDFELNLKLSMAGYRFHLWPGIGGFLRQHESPHRITKTSHVFENSSSWLSQIKTRYQRFEDHFDGEPPRAFQRHVAQQAWTSGRKLFRDGRKQDATKYFDFARLLNVGVPPNSPRLYQRAVRVLGAEYAEEMLRYIRPE